MCQAHEIHMEKYPRWSFLRSKIEMSKSKIENAKIENSKNPRLLSEESAEHPTLPLPVRGRCPSLVYFRGFNVESENYFADHFQ